MSEYHNPVLLKESIDCLVMDSDGIYMDLTYGGGGHSKEILDRLSPNGKLIAFDQDAEAKENLKDDDRLIFVASNYRYLYRFWKWLDIGKVDGILADLGVSSHQFDAGYRGFSFRFDAALDMRMNQDAPKTAADILNTYSAQELQNILSQYGEVRNAKTLAHKIVDLRRQLGSIETTKVLNMLLDESSIGDKNKYFAQVYQALRIEVNEEIVSIEEMLEGGAKVLKEGGKFVVISYHSLEDRLVKRFFKSGNVAGKLEKDMYGNVKSDIKMDKKLIIPTQEEMDLNPRSRSAKMRVAVRK